jgi:hypothetical protein
MGFIKGSSTRRRPRLFFLLAVARWSCWSGSASDRVERVGYGCSGSWRVLRLRHFDPNFRLIVTKPDNVPIVG